MFVAWVTDSHLIDSYAFLIAAIQRLTAEGRMGWLISKALMRDYENSHCSQERAEGYLADTCSDGEQSAQSNTSHTPQAYLSSDKMTAFSRLSRFGMTCERLERSRGEELLTWYQGEFPAKTLASQGKEQGLMESGQDCGQRWPGLLAKYDPSTHTLKTAQCSLLGDCGESCVTLPRSGTMRNGAVYQRQSLAQEMIEIESGYSGEKFPTPTARDYKGARSDDAMKATGRNQATNSLPDYLASIGQRGQMNPQFREWLLGWPLTWTDLKPQGTARFREWLLQHSISWRED